jgi:hypothetical protein
MKTLPLYLRRVAERVAGHSVAALGLNEVITSEVTLGNGYTLVVAADGTPLRVFNTDGDLQPVTALTKASEEPLTGTVTGELTLADGRRLTFKDILLVGVSLSGNITDIQPAARRCV